MTDSQENTSPTPDSPTNKPDQGADVPEMVTDLTPILGDKVGNFTKAERRWISKAFHLAREKHKGVTRKSGAPYIEHPIATARILMDMGMDWKSICAGFLHDTIEDTDLTYADIKKDFPDPIADLVNGVTKISSLNFRSTQEQQSENLRKMIMAMARDIRVILIKLADRLHNILTLQYLPVHKQRKIAKDTLQLYAPLAGRLGIYRIKSQLEDGAMRYLYPTAYHDLADKVSMKRKDRERHIQQSIRVLKEELARNGIDAVVTGRWKHFWSIFNKMRNQKRSLEEIYDLNAVRVICNTKKECYEILGIIHSIWKPVPEHFFDYIALPKGNHYQSIHTKVIGEEGRLTEIQVRTQEMHNVAEQGIAAHWNYKEEQTEDSKGKTRMAWTRQMLGWLQDDNDPNELLLDLKREAFESKVFCFTPLGKVIEMGRGATVLDFAYRIHTDLGHRCTGGKINTNFVPLRTVLKMGDIVEIATSKKPHPSPDWLKIVTTSRARAKIRHYLKQQNYDENLLRGREMIIRALGKAGIHVSTQELQDVIDPHLNRLHVKSVDEMFAEVGFGTISTSIVVGRFLPTPAERSRRRVPTPSKKKKQDGLEPSVLVDGMPGTLTRFAQCCKPQPGDEIAGFITRGRGVSIHHRDCAHLDRWISESPNNLSRFVPVSWAGSADEMFRKIGIRIIAEDRKGILADVAQALTNKDIVIVASSSRSNPRSHRATLRFSVMLQNDTNIESLLKHLSKIPEVEEAKRDLRDA